MHFAQRTSRPSAPIAAEDIKYRVEQLGQVKIINSSLLGVVGFLLSLYAIIPFIYKVYMVFAQHIARE